MKVLVVECGKDPYIKDIPPGLSSLQAEVGGYIEAIYPFEDQIALICNESGKIDKLTPNRLLLTENGSAYDYIAGTFLVVGLADSSFTGLSDEQVKTYLERFSVESVGVVVG